VAQTALDFQIEGRLKPKKFQTAFYQIHCQNKMFT